jgi:hypothetical protein
MTNSSSSSTPHHVPSHYHFSHCTSPLSLWKLYRATDRTEEEACDRSLSEHTEEKPGRDFGMKLRIEDDDKDGARPGGGVWW